MWLQICPDLTLGQEYVSIFRSLLCKHIVPYQLKLLQQWVRLII